jgi:hypothetical protein
VARLTTRRAILLGLAAIGVGGGGLAWSRCAHFPPDTTPEGAYLRISAAVNKDDARSCFAYLEDRAQHAAYSIRDYRRLASERIAAAYPEPERTRLLDAYRPHATAEDGADVWNEMARRLGWLARLRKDLSGITSVEIAGERATIQTARGTRYAFRRRENGIWGLSLFTAELVAESERAARDAEGVEKAARDYDRGK